jgi:glycosyltransferase involved in cell wall biosynthesis
VAISVEVTGDFLVESSLARVNRGLFGALARRPEIDLAILPEPTAAPIVGTLDDELLQARRRKRFLPEPQITIRHRWPAVFPRLNGGRYVHMQPWEFGSLPAVWAEQLSECADEVWCYSRYLADMYVRAGLAEERVAVVPLGYDPQIFRPGSPPASATLHDRCAFLYVGDTIARKGVDLAVSAYLTAFKPADKVVLIVKDFGGKDPSDDSRLRDRVAALAGRADIPPVLYIDTFYTDAALADLYRAAAALVAPYRGEGFGLPVLEAMACGVATIVTRGGATDDFTTAQTTIHVDATEVKLGRSYGGFELVGEAFWLEPSEPALVAALRRVYENPAEARAMGARASEAVRGWTWSESAARAVSRLQHVAAAPSRAGQRGGGASTIAPFELKIASRGGEDGVLLEIFRRLGVDDPCVIECVAAGESPSISTYLTRALGWRGVVIEGDAGVYAEFTKCLTDAGVPRDFELLVLPADGDPAWARLIPYRPQVIVTTDGPNAPKALAAQHGYTWLGSESHGTSAFFLRDDLLERSRFAVPA